VRLVIQRVSEASVTVTGQTVAQIGPGLCILVGVGKNDTVIKNAALVDKVKNLRIFADGLGKMNRSVSDIGGAILLVSQFTLYADCRRGNRPSFTEAAPPGVALDIYERFTQQLRDAGVNVVTGQFQAHMQLALMNDGPVTVILEN